MSVPAGSVTSGASTAPPDPEGPSLAAAPPPAAHLAAPAGRPPSCARQRRCCHHANDDPTVTDVLANGNLEISGEKQMLINQGNEYIRFSGVVTPTTISSTSTVLSTQVADARIEYSARGFINEGETMGWLQRIFLSVAPF